MKIFLATLLLVASLAEPLQSSQNTIYENFITDNHSIEYLPFDKLQQGNILLFGKSDVEISHAGIYVGEQQFILDEAYDPYSDKLIQTLENPEWQNSYRGVLRLEDDLSFLMETIETESAANASVAREKIPLSTVIPPFLSGYDCYAVNKKEMPYTISPKAPLTSLDSFLDWAKGHQEEFREMLDVHGAILFRNFPIEKGEEFAAVVESVIGLKPINYIGEGSRAKVAEGVYTSTEAPAWCHIPLHNEYTCTNTPLHYICFYCDIAPEPSTGQTILGLTREFSQEILTKRPAIWNFFEGKKVRYISRHPPTGSFFAKVNKTHRTWQQAFETDDKQEVERICKEKGLQYKWLGGDWIEVARLVPAIHEPDEHFDYPYFFNQAYLYHGNPRIRGGWLNHVLANLLYIVKSTNQYDIELEDGTPLPRDIVYGIYDIANEVTIKFDWQKGDTLLIDNFKGLHGKAPSKGQRRILVCMIQ